MSKNAIQTPDAPAAIGTYSQAIRFMRNRKYWKNAPRKAAQGKES